MFFLHIGKVTSQSLLYKYSMKVMSDSVELKGLSIDQFIVEKLKSPVIINLCQWKLIQMSVIWLLSKLREMSKSPPGGLYMHPVIYLISCQINLYQIDSTGFLITDNSCQLRDLWIASETPLPCSLRFLR